MTCACPIEHQNAQFLRVRDQILAPSPASNRTAVVVLDGKCEPYRRLDLQSYFTFRVDSWYAKITSPSTM